jgi:triosephosphate isomerase
MIRPMRPVIVAGNWKMHTSPADAGELAHVIASRTRVAGVTRILCPPYVCLAAVRDAVAAEGVEIGAQNVHHEPAGAYTGEVSAAMLTGLASWVIVGHSERRRDAGETDALINRKLLAAHAAGLRVILCVGEQLSDRDAGLAATVVASQVHQCVENAHLGHALDPAAPWLTVAYEPVWAIGTGRTARGSDAAAIAAVIRETLADHGATNRGEDVPVLYGGSVTGTSIDEFMSEPSIDGALVGGASLKPDEMAAIVARAGLTAAARAGVAAG